MEIDDVKHTIIALVDAAGSSGAWRQIELSMQESGIADPDAAVNELRDWAVE